METYILHWGEMGSRWGVNRTVAQIQALLYLSPEPLCADDITQLLSISRSNVSMGVRELNGYNIIKVTQKLGDRRDFFSTETDTWALFMKVLEARKHKEIDPTIAALKLCLSEPDQETPEEVKQRIANMLTFLETSSDWFGHMKAIPFGTLNKLMKLGANIKQFVKT